MMYNLLKESAGNILGFKIGEDITAEDVHDMDKIMADAIATSGRIRLLIEIEGFRHMDTEALLEKMKFARDHVQHIEKMAVVSDRVWIKSWLKIGGLFTHKEAEHFIRAEMESAWEWLRQPKPS
jgi:hypothetical protein